MQPQCTYITTHRQCKLYRCQWSNRILEKSKTSVKQTTCHPLLLASYWLEERNWSNCILSRKKRRLLFKSSDMALVFLSNTYVWSQIILQICLQLTGYVAQVVVQCSQRPALLSAAWFWRRFSSCTVKRPRLFRCSNTIATTCHLENQNPP